MGSWLYAFLIQQPGVRLLASEPLVALQQEDLEIDEDVIEVVPDKEGHCEPTGRQHRFLGGGVHEATSLLEKGIDLLVTFRDKEMYFSCTFARCARSPHVMIGWSANLFQAMSNDKRMRYLNVLASFCQVARAGCVAFVRDPPGYFEDRVVIVNGGVLVDAVLPTGHIAEVYEIWARSDEVNVQGGRVFAAGKVGVFSKYVVAPIS